MSQYWVVLGPNVVSSTGIPLDGHAPLHPAFLTRAAYTCRGKNPPSWEQELWWISGWRGCVSIPDKEACYDKAPESGDILADVDLLQCLKVLW